MKKIIFTIMVGVLGLTIWSMPVLAATNISFSPPSITVKQGQTFMLTTSVNPQGIKNYTVKLELNYPVELLEVKSFTFGSTWMPLSQSGYDSIDNTKGILIKTAGYPGGLSSTASFGTVSFLAKKAGSGTITIGNNSLALDSTNKNVLSGTPQVSVLITAPVVTTIPPTTKAATIAKVSPTTKAPTMTTIETIVTETSTTTTLISPVLGLPISRMNPLLATLLGITSHLNPWFTLIVAFGSFGGAIYLAKNKKK